MLAPETSGVAGAQLFLFPARISASAAGRQSQYQYTLQADEYRTAPGMGAENPVCDGETARD